MAVSSGWATTTQPSCVRPLQVSQFYVVAPEGGSECFKVLIGRDSKVALGWEWRLWRGDSQRGFSC